MNIGRLGALGAEALIDAYAHELAEAIRENWRGRFSAFTDRTSVGSARFWARGAEGAADLIDPEVTL